MNIYSQRLSNFLQENGLVPDWESAGVAHYKRCRRLFELMDYYEVVKMTNPRFI